MIIKHQFTLSIASIFIFFFLLYQVVSSGFILTFDQWVNSSIEKIHLPWLTMVMIAITTISSTKFMLFFSGLLFCYLLWKKKRKDALVLTTVMLGSLLLQIGLKLAVDRDRPLNGFVDTSHDIVFGSFPSGHAMMTTAFIAVVLFIFWNSLTYKKAIAGSLFGFTILVGFSRIYLSVHWTSDVIAGFSLGIIWCIIVYVLEEHIFSRTLF